MPTTTPAHSLQPPVQKKPAISLVGAAFDLGLDPHWLRRYAEYSWYETTFEERWNRQYAAAPVGLGVLLNGIDDLRASLVGLLKRSRFVTMECGCLPALSNFRTHLQSEWEAPWSKEGRQQYAYLEDPVLLGPRFEPIPVFESRWWQDFAISLRRLAKWLAEPYLTFFTLGEHLGRVIFPSVTEVLARQGWGDYRIATERVVKETDELLIRVAEDWDSSEWWWGPWQWKDMLRDLGAARTKEDRYDMLGALLNVLRKTLPRSFLKTAPFKPIKEVQGRFGLRATVNSTEPYTAFIYRIGTHSNQERLEVRGHTARVVVGLIRETARATRATKESLCRSNGPAPNSLSYYISTARTECFNHLGINVKSDRSLGYRLTENLEPTKRVRKG